MAIERLFEEMRREQLLAAAKASDERTKQLDSNHLTDAEQSNTLVVGLLGKIQLLTDLQADVLNKLADAGIKQPPVEFLHTILPVSEVTTKPETESLSNAHTSGNGNESSDVKSFPTNGTIVSFSEFKAVKDIHIGPEGRGQRTEKIVSAAFALNNDQDSFRNMGIDEIAAEAFSDVIKGASTQGEQRVKQSQSLNSTKVILQKLFDQLEGKLSASHDSRTKYVLDWIKQHPFAVQLNLSELRSLVFRSADQEIYQKIGLRAPEAPEGTKDHTEKRSPGDLTGLEEKTAYALLALDDARSGLRHATFLSSSYEVYGDVIANINDESEKIRKAQSGSASISVMRPNIIKKMKEALENPSNLSPRMASLCDWINNQPEYAGVPIDQIFLVIDRRISLDQLKKPSSS